LNFDHCDLPFDLAQGGELVEPFAICVLLFEIFIAETRPLTPETFCFLQHIRQIGLGFKSEIN
jgi:hypothetical protein